MQRTRHVAAAAKMMVKDTESGVEFPLGQKFWSVPFVGGAKQQEPSMQEAAPAHLPHLPNRACLPVVCTHREGAECRCLGATTRSKQILVIKAQVSTHMQQGMTGSVSADDAQRSAGARPDLCAHHPSKCAVHCCSSG